MAKPTTFKFSEMLIEIEDIGPPVAWVAPCGLTAKAFNGTAATTDTNVPDCDDPDAASWLERDVVSLARDISGDGVLAGEYKNEWDDWFTSGNTRNVRISIPPVDPKSQWTGAYLLTTFNITGGIGEKLKVAVVMQSDGQITRVDTP